MRRGWRTGACRALTHTSTKNQTAKPNQTSKPNQTRPNCQTKPNHPACSPASPLGLVVNGGHHPHRHRQHAHVAGDRQPRGDLRACECQRKQRQVRWTACGQMPPQVMPQQMMPQQRNKLRQSSSSTTPPTSGSKQQHIVQQNSSRTASCMNTWRRSTRCASVSPASVWCPPSSSSSWPSTSSASFLPPWPSAESPASVDALPEADLEVVRAPAGLLSAAAASSAALAAAAAARRRARIDR